jgi:hypothetical protein
MQVRVTQTTVQEGGPYRQLKVEDALAYLDKVSSYGAVEVDAPLGMVRPLPPLVVACTKAGW